MSLCNDVAITMFLEEQLRIVPDTARGVLLDLGCGTQPYRSLYHNLFKQTVAGDYCVRSRIDTRLDICSLPFMDEVFDAVILSEVIEHIDDPVRALSEVSRVLKKGGLIFLTWPFMHPLHEMPHDYARYTEFGMNRLLRKTGFQLEVLARRGDVITLGLAVVEQCAFNVMEALVRLPLFGAVLFGWMKPLTHRTASTLWRIYLSSIGRLRRFHPEATGEQLKGPINHLTLWTLGYCARGKKVGGGQPCAPS